MNADAELLSVRDFCKTAGIGRTKVYELLGKGDIKAVKIGRRTFLRRADVMEWVEGLRPYERHVGHADV